MNNQHQDLFKGLSQNQSLCDWVRSTYILKMVVEIVSYSFDSNSTLALAATQSSKKGLVVKEVKLENWLLFLSTMP